MAPKKGQKMSLNAFLEEQSLGSWADEMDSLPTAPAQKTDEERARMNERGFDRRDRDYGTRPERSQPQREELPLPTEPPYTAFIGNLPFDLSEDDLGDFFNPSATKSVKIIRDRDDKPKGFGYVEFETLDGLKEGLAKSGGTFQNRTVRVSVAAPPQQRTGFGDDEKFAGNWRREGPLPDRPSSRSRFDEDRGPRAAGDKPSSMAESNTDWRANRPPPPAARFDEGPRPARRSGFSTPTGEPSAADTADEWTIGSKFKPSSSNADGPPRGRFGGVRSERGDFGSGLGPVRKESTASEGSDWRSIMRPSRPDAQERSPSNSTPPTPQMGRRKLELMPRSASGGSSATNSPLASPNVASATITRSSPFGGAKPVDVSARESEVTERLQKEREELSKHVAEKTSMARTSSKTAKERQTSHTEKLSPPHSPSRSAGPKDVSATSSKTILTPGSAIRPSFSFANAAGGTKATPTSDSSTSSPAPSVDIPEAVAEDQTEAPSTAIDEVTEKISEISV